MASEQRDAPPEPSGDHGQHARRRLVQGPDVRTLRRFWRWLPGSPRCKLCHSPLEGGASPVMRLIGKGPWPGNPKYCGGCFRAIYKHREGAEIPCALLFVDVRSSTTMAEAMSPGEFRGLLDRFYETAVGEMVQHEAIVDKFVGDEVIGIFAPVLAGELYARRAVDAGLAILRATGNDGSHPWVPVGGGVDAGIAYVGAVGTAEHVEFTALGDVVNVTARLATDAAAGELLVTERAMGAAQLDGGGLERRRLMLKGKGTATEVAVLTPAATPSAR